MGKGGAKIEVSEYYMSQHFGICTIVDAIKRILIKEKVAWTGHLTEQTSWRIKEEDLFGGNKKEGGAVGTIYWLPGRGDQVLPDELAQRLGRADGADCPGYRGLSSLFFTGRPDDNDGALGFNWSANNPYLPGVWATVERAPVGLDPAYAMIPRPGTDFHPTAAATSGGGLDNMAFSPDYSRIYLISGDTVLVYETSSYSLLATVGFDAALSIGNPIGVGTSALYAIDKSTFPHTLRTADKDNPSVWTTVATTAADGSSGVLCVNDTPCIKSVAGAKPGAWFGSGAITYVTSSPSLGSITYFGDLDGNIWSAGGNAGDLHIDCLSGPRTGENYVRAGLAPAETCLIANPDGDFFAINSSGRYVLANADFSTISSVVAAQSFAPPAIEQMAAGSASVWCGTNEISTTTLGVLQTLNTSLWLPGATLEIAKVFDPSNNALIVHPTAGAPSGWYWLLTGGELDANPAHMIFEALTNTDWGMGSPTSLIDVAGFEAVGIVLYDEPLGLSMLWTRQAAIQDFIQEILDHIQGVLFVDPQTGLLTLKLIRGDYDVADLPTISPSTANLTSFGRKLWGEIVNEISVTWTSPDTELEETVTAQDLGSITTQGGIVSDSRNYYGVRYAALAQRLGARDLRSAGAPLATMEAEVDRSFYYLRPASVLLVDWPEYGLDGVVARVTSIDYGKPGDPTIKINLIEDVFGLDQGDYVDPPTSAWEDTSADPTPMIEQAALTLPYFFAANGITDFSGATYPEVMAGVLGASDNADAFQFELWGEVTLPGGGTEWQSLATLNISAYATLSADLDAEASSTGVSFTAFVGSASPSSGGFAVLPGTGEDASEVALITAASTTYSLSRGVLDTVPKAWAAGSPVWFVKADGIFEDPTLRSAGEVVDYKLLTRTSLGLLSLVAAPLLTETLNERPWLPSRPAKVEIDGVQFNDISTPVDMIGETVVPVTWANRNRLTEDTTVLGWTDATVTPETGQTTTITVLKTDGVTVLDTITSLSGTSHDVPVASFGAEAIGLIKVTAARTDSDGTFDSLQGIGIYVQVDVAIALGLSSETDSAFALGLVIGTGLPVGRSNETDTALGLGGSLTPGRASETDTALGLTQGLFDPATLYTGGLVGFWYDFSDLSTLFQDSAGTIPVTTDGDPVGKVLDKSGNNYHLTQATSGKRPIWHTSGGLCWIELDGTDDYMDATFSGGAMAQANDVSIGFRVNTLTGVMNIFDGITNREALVKPTTGSGNLSLFSTSTVGTSTTIAASTDYVLTSRFNGASSKIRKNRVDGTTISPGTVAMNGFRLGCFGGTGGFTNGRYYGVIARDTVFTSTDLANLEIWLGAKAGLSL